MSGRLRRWAFFPTSLLLRKDLKAVRFKTIAAVTFVLMIGLFPNRPDDLTHIEGWEITWIGIAIACDVLIFLPLYNATRKNARLDHALAQSNLFFFVFFCLNMLLVFLPIFTFLHGMYMLFHMGFFRELGAMSLCLWMQCLLAVGLRGTSMKAYLEILEREDASGMLKVRDGLAETAGIYFYGLFAFLVFHLVSAAVLSKTMTECVENRASTIKGILEHPFGTLHPGIKLWVIFALLFALASCLASPRLRSATIKMKRAESVVEGLLLGFVFFSVLSSEVEQPGMRTESRLAKEADTRLFIVGQLLAEASIATPEENRTLLRTLIKLEQPSTKAGESVAFYAVSSLENSGDVGTDRARVSDGGRLSWLLSPPMDDGRSPLEGLKVKRARTEIQVEAATKALQETLAASSRVAGQALLGGSREAGVLVDAIGDFVSENSEYSLKAVCHHVLSVFTGREAPPPAVASDLPSLLSTAEQTERGERSTAGGGDTTHDTEPREGHIPKLRPIK
jgi:hypothetical protein